ncbi:unnamed protein product [Caenorhabditis brenneri]
MQQSLRDAQLECLVATGEDREVARGVAARRFWKEGASIFEIRCLQGGMNSKPLYKEHADWVVETAYKAPKEVVTRVVSASTAVYESFSDSIQGRIQVSISDVLLIACLAMVLIMIYKILVRLVKKAATGKDQGLPTYVERKKQGVKFAGQIRHEVSTQNGRTLSVGLASVATPAIEGQTENSQSAAMKGVVLLLIIVFSTGIHNENYNFMRCKPYIGEIFNPMEFIGHGVSKSPSCAYYGLSIPDHCLREFNLKLHDMEMLIWNYHLNSLYSVARFSTIRDNFKKVYEWDPERTVKRKSRGDVYQSDYYISNGLCDHKERFIDNKNRTKLTGSLQKNAWTQRTSYDEYNAGDGMVFLLMDMSNLTTAEEKEAHAIHKSKILTRNTFDIAVLEPFYKYILDVQVLLTRDESFEQEGSVLQALFPNYIPHIFLSPNVKNGLSAMTRCFEAFNSSAEDETIAQKGAVFDEACKKYAMPLWMETSSRDSPRISFDRKSGCQREHNMLEYDIDDVKWKDYLEKNFRFISEPTNFDISQIKEETPDTPSADVEMEVGVSGDSIQPGHPGLSQNVETPRAWNGGRVPMRNSIVGSHESMLIQEIYRMQKIQMEEMQSLAQSTQNAIIQYQNDLRGVQAVRQYGFKLRGYRDYNGADPFIDVCTTYFKNLSNILKRCVRSYDINHYYLETFVHKRDKLLSKLRSSTDNVGLPEPTMDCAPYNASLHRRRIHVPRSGTDGEELDDANDDDARDEDDLDEDGEEIRVHVTHDEEEDEEEEELNYPDRLLDRLQLYSDDDDDEPEDEGVSMPSQRRYKRDAQPSTAEMLADQLRGSLSADDTFDTAQFRLVMTELGQPYKVNHQEAQIRNPHDSHLWYPEGLCMTVHERSERGFKSMLQRFRRMRDSTRHGRTKSKIAAAVKDSVDYFESAAKTRDLTKQYSRTVYNSLKYSISARITQKIHTLNEINGFPVGSNHYSRDSFHKMALAISEELHLSVIRHILDTGARFSLLVDGSNDKAAISVAAVQIRTLVDYWPTTLHWDLLPKSGDAGSDYLISLIQSLHESVELLQRDNSTFMRSFASQWLSTTTDGASNMRSKFWTHAKAFKDEMRLNVNEDISLPDVWCTSHYLETVLKNMDLSDSTLRLAETILSSLHLLFGTESYSTTRQWWRQKSRQYNGVEYSWGRVHKVRWVGSMKSLMERLMKQYPVLLITIKSDLLERIGSKNDKFSMSMKRRLFTLHYVLSDIRVYLRLNGLYNLLHELTTASHLLQQEALLMGDAEFIFNTTLNKLQHHLITVMDKNLSKKHKRFYGLRCIDKSKGNKVIACPSSSIQNVFTTPYNVIGAFQEEFVLVAVPAVLKGDQDFIQAHHPNYVVKLRVPGDMDEDFKEEFYKQFGKFQETLKNATKRTGNKTEDAKVLSNLEEEQKKFLEKALDFNETSNVPLIRMYNTIGLNVYSSFQKELLADLRASVKTQLDKTTISELRFYAVSIDVLADIASCAHSFDPDLVLTNCTWPTDGSQLEIMRSRHHPFYMTSTHLYTSKRREVLLRSLDFLADSLKKPTIKNSYLTWMTSFRKHINGTNVLPHNHIVLKHIVDGNTTALRNVSGALVTQTFLKFADLLQLPSDIRFLLETTMIVSPTTASVERSFSHLNHFKNAKSTRMLIPMENARLRSIWNGPGVNRFDPQLSALRFLRSNSLPVTRDNRVNYLTAIRDENRLDYGFRKVVLNPGPGKPTYVSSKLDSRTAADPITYDWYNRDNSLVTLSRNSKPN